MKNYNILALLLLAGKARASVCPYATTEVVVRELLDDMDWDPDVLSPGVSSPNTASLRAFACGIAIGSDRWDGQGMTSFKFMMCNLYDWDSQAELVISEATTEPEFEWFAFEMCPTGWYIDKIRFKENLSSLATDDDEGFYRVQFMCSNPFDFSTIGTTTTWLEAPHDDEEFDGEWTDITWTTEDDPKNYIVGGVRSFGDKEDCMSYICGPDDVGFAAMKLILCKIEVDCSSQLVLTSTDVPNTHVAIAPPAAADPTLSGSRAYRQTTADWGVFADYITNSDTGQCTTTCDLYKDCTTLLTFADDAWLSTRNTGTNPPLADLVAGTTPLLQVNTDPEAMFSLSVCIKCSNKDATIQTNTFTIQADCDSSIEVTEPAGLTYNVAGDVDADPASWLTLPFSSFQTNTKACPVASYELVSTQAAGTFPVGLVDENFSENAVSGTVSSNSFTIKLQDGANPFVYQFAIKALAFSTNGNTPAHLYAPVNPNSANPTGDNSRFSISAACPSSIALNPVTTLATTHASYVGEVDAAYTFPEFKSSLPKCGIVEEYRLASVSPAGKLTYPSTLCTLDPCLKIDIDTAVTATITFQIEVVTSTGATQTASTITINVPSTPLTPELTAPALTTQKVLLDSSTPFTFSPFTCTTGCPVTIYESTASSSARGVTATGVASTASFNSLSGNYELALTDTSVKAVYQFYIYAASTAPAIHQCSAMATVEVICGSEEILVPAALKQQEFSPLIPSSTGITYYSSLLSSFSSSKPSRCPIDRFDLFSDVALSSPQTTDPILLIDGATPASARIKIVHSTMKQTVYLRASTAQESAALISNYVALTFQVCGAEAVTAVAQPSASYSVLLEKTAQTEVTFSGWFTTSFDTATSHSDCTALTYSIMSGSTCTTPVPAAHTSQFTTSVYLGQDIFRISGSSSMLASIICLVGSTVGKVAAFHKFSIEICGSESISFSPESSSLDKVINYQHNGDGKVHLELSSEGFGFLSDRPNCLPRAFRVVKSDQLTTFTPSSQVSVSVSADFNPTIVLDSRRSLALTSLFIEGASLNQGSKAYLPFNLEICGSEQVEAETLVQLYTAKIGTSPERIIEGVYRRFFKVDSKACPLDIFDIVLKTSEDPLIYTEISTLYGQLMAATDITQEEAERLVYIDPSSKVFILNSTLPLGIVDLMAEFDEDDSMSQFGGALKILSTKLELEVFLRARTTGNVPGYTAFKMVWVAASAWKTMNFPPRFASGIYPLDLVVSSFSQKAYPTYSYKTELPRIIDPEGDEVKFEACSLPYVRFKKLDPTLYRLQVDKLKIGKADHGNQVCKITLTDSAGNSFTQDLELRIEYQDSLLAMDDIEFQQDVSNCQPFVKIVSYSYKCNAEGFSLRLCQIIGQKAAYIDGMREKKNLPVDMEAEITAFNQEVASMDIRVYRQINIKFDSKIMKEGITKLMSKGETITPSDFSEGVLRSEFVLKGITLAQYPNNGTLYGKECTGSSFAEQMNARSDESYATELVAQGLGVTEDLLKNKEFDCASSQGGCPTPVPLRVKKAKFDQSSRLLITFNQNLMLPEADDALEFIVKTHFKFWVESGAESGMVNHGQFFSSKEWDSREVASSGGPTSDSSDMLFFSWRVESFSMNELEIQVEFAFPEMISSSPFGRDVFNTEIIKNELLIGQSSRDNLVEDDLKVYKATIFPLITFPKFAENMKQIAKALTTAVAAMAVVAIVISGLQNKSMQDFWSMLNSQQVSIHLALINVPNIPSNALALQNNLKDLNQRDMYPTDLIYEKVFAFTETASLNDLFDEMGYEGGVFIALTGSLLINIVLVLLNSVGLALLNLVLKFNYKKQWARRLGVKTSQELTSVLMMRLLVSGYLELVICGVVAVIQTPFRLILAQHFTGNGRRRLEEDDTEELNPMDYIDRFIALIALVFCLATPFYFYSKISRNAHALGDPEFAKRYSYMYSDLRTDHHHPALFNVFFMLRRLLFASIIVLGFEVGNLQLLAHMVLSVAYTAYLMSVKPFEDPSMNRKEVFNEVCIILITNVYAVFMTNPVFSGQAYAGWLFVALYMSVFGFNLQGIGKKMFLQDFPDTLRRYKKKFEAWRVRTHQERWMAMKQKRSLLFPSSSCDQNYFSQAIKIAKKQEALKKMRQLLDQREAELRWLEENRLPSEEIKDEVERFKLQLATNTLIEAEGEDELARVRLEHVELPVNNMLTRLYVHNSIQVIKVSDGIPPYNQDLLSRILEKSWFINRYEYPAEREVRAIRTLKRAKNQALYHYLQMLGFRCLKSKSNGVPKGISLYAFGSTSKHPDVRQEVCQRILMEQVSESKRRAKESEAIEAFEATGRALEPIVESGGPFGLREIEAACHIYRIPIVVFDGDSQRAFFDLEFVPEQPISKQPLYLLKSFDPSQEEDEDDERSPDTFTVLVHPKQKKFRKQLKANSILGRPFTFRPFFSAERFFADPKGAIVESLVELSRSSRSSEPGSPGGVAPAKSSSSSDNASAAIEEANFTFQEEDLVVTKK